MPLGIAFAYTGQQKYAEGAKKYVMAWVNAYYTEKDKNRSRFTGFRGNAVDYREYHNLIKAYAFTRNSGAYTSEEKAKVEKWMNELGDYFVRVDPYDPATTSQICGDRTPCFSFRNTGNWNAASFQLITNLYVVTKNPRLEEFLFTKGYWKKFLNQEFVLQSGIVNDIAKGAFCTSFGNGSGDKLPYKAIADFHEATGYTPQNSGSYTSKCTNTASNLIINLPYSLDANSKEYKARQFFLRYPRRSTYLDPDERNSNGSIRSGEDGIATETRKIINRWDMPPCISYTASMR